MNQQHPIVGNITDFIRSNNSDIKNVSYPLCVLYEQYQEEFALKSSFQKIALGIEELVSCERGKAKACIRDIGASAESENAASGAILVLSNFDSISSVGLLEYVARFGHFDSIKRTSRWLSSELLSQGVEGGAGGNELEYYTSMSTEPSVTSVAGEFGEDQINGLLGVLAEKSNESYESLLEILRG